MWPFKKTPKVFVPELRVFCGDFIWKYQGTPEELEEKAKEIEVQMNNGLVRINGYTYEASKVWLLRDW